MSWRKLSLWRLTIALAKGTIEWWADPRYHKKPVLRSRAGHFYEYQRTPEGLLIRRKEEGGLTGVV